MGIGLLVVSSLGGHDHPGSVDHGTSVDDAHPGFFNLRVVSVFLATFGACGMLAEYYGLSLMFSTGIAFVGGIVFAEIARRCLGKLMTIQAESNLNTDFTGLEGIVTLPMENGSPGEVTVISKNGQQIWLTAYSKDGQAIEMNAKVRIVVNSGNSVQVEKI